MIMIKISAVFCLNHVFSTHKAQTWDFAQGILV